MDLHNAYNPPLSTTKGAVLASQPLVSRHLAGSVDTSCHGSARPCTPISAPALAGAGMRNRLSLDAFPASTERQNQGRRRRSTAALATPALDRGSAHLSSQPPRRVVTRITTCREG